MIEWFKNWHIFVFFNFVDFGHQKLTFKVWFWHFLSNCHSSTVVFKTQVCWFRPKILLCRTHYLWIFTTELISENNYSIFNLIIQYSFDKYGFKNRLGPSAISQRPLKKWTEHSQELHLLKINSRGLLPITLRKFVMDWQATPSIKKFLILHPMAGWGLIFWTMSFYNPKKFISRSF